MKVPPKRKGNWGNSDGSVHVAGKFGVPAVMPRLQAAALNESPSEKEGKSKTSPNGLKTAKSSPSMKVPPKRKGNTCASSLEAEIWIPQ